MDFEERRRIDPLKIGLAIFFLVCLVFVVIVARAPGAVVDTPHADGLTSGPSSAPASTPSVDPAELVKKLDGKKTKTKKGELLKGELKKKALAEKAKSAPTRVAVATPSTGVVLSGDSGLKKTFQRKLGGVKIVEDAASGWFLSLKADTGFNHDGTIFAKCSAAISELPARKLVASLSDRADVGGEGVEPAELKQDAMDACANSLAEDVSQWVRTHR